MSPYILDLTIFICLTKFSSEHAFDSYIFNAYPNIINNNLSPINATHCKWLTKHCGKSDVRMTSQQVMKIHSGQVVQLGQLPWVVFVCTKTQADTMQEHRRRGRSSRVLKTSVSFGRCVGTLISYRHVFTAAHCLYNRFHKNTLVKNSTLFVTQTTYKAKLRMRDVNLLSEHMIKREETARFVSPDFTGTSDYKMYDYAIIEFHPPIDEAEMNKYWSFVFVRPACLPEHGLQIADSFRIAGWGETDASTVAPIILQTAIVNKKQCDFDYYPLQLCTTSSAGAGDSGSGYIQQNNNRSTVVAVLGSNNVNVWEFPIGTIGYSEEQSGTLLIVPSNVTDQVRVCIPMKWIQDNIWPDNMNCYADNRQN